MLIDGLPSRDMLQVRVELMIRAAEEIQRVLAELDRLDGAPPAKRRRGLKVVDGGKS